MTHSVRLALAGGIAVAGTIWLGGCAAERADWLVRRDANHLNARAKAELRDPSKERAIADNWAGTREERGDHYNPYEFGRGQ